MRIKDCEMRFNARARARDARTRLKCENADLNERCAPNSTHNQMANDA